MIWHLRWNSLLLYAAIEQEIIAFMSTAWPPRKLYSFHENCKTLQWFSRQFLVRLNIQLPPKLQNALQWVISKSVWTVSKKDINTDNLDPAIAGQSYKKVGEGPFPPSLLLSKFWSNHAGAQNFTIPQCHCWSLPKSRGAGSRFSTTDFIVHAVVSLSTVVANGWMHVWR